MVALRHKEEKISHRKHLNMPMQQWYKFGNDYAYFIKIARTADSIENLLSSLESLDLLAF